MNGFFIKHNDTDICIALETGSLGIMVTNKDGEFTLSCNGMDGDGVYYSWYNEKIDLNDLITIKHGNIDESMVSSVTFVRDVNNKETENRLLLDTYKKLKQELIDEGLIYL